MSLVLRFSALVLSFAPTIPAWAHASVLPHTHTSSTAAAVGIVELGVAAVIVMGTVVVILRQQMRRNRRFANGYLYPRSKQ